MQILDQKTYDFDDVLIRPRHSEISSREEVNTTVSYICKHAGVQIRGCPVIVANMDTCGSINMAKALHEYKIFVALHKYYDPKDLIEFFKTQKSEYSFYTLGISNDDMYKLKHVSGYAPIKRICLDVANGYMYSFLDKIKHTRTLFQDAIIMAGNVATPEGVENIIKAGADCAKCGIANGGYCDSKHKTGIGLRQFTVAQECGQAAQELNALCCSDGGIREIGDICKCLGAGAHFTMCGSLFCGYEECDGEWDYEYKSNISYGSGQEPREIWVKESVPLAEKRKYRLKVYGMSSRAANDKYNGGLKTYRTSEGKEGYVEYKGPVSELAIDIKGGLASCCSYVGVKNLENLYKYCVFTI